MNSEKFISQEKNRLTQLPSESEKYRKQSETSLSDSEKQLKSTNDYESVSSKLSQELQATKATVESYQKHIEIAINEKEKAISELQSMKINQANSDANLASIKEELELTAAKIAAKQEENKNSLKNSVIENFTSKIRSKCSIIQKSS